MINTQPVSLSLSHLRLARTFHGKHKTRRVCCFTSAALVYIIYVFAAHTHRPRLNKYIYIYLELIMHRSPSFVCARVICGPKSKAHRQFLSVGLGKTIHILHTTHIVVQSICAAIFIYIV